MRKRLRLIRFYPHDSAEPQPLTSEILALIAASFGPSITLQEKRVSVDTKAIEPNARFINTAMKGGFKAGDVVEIGSAPKSFESLDLTTVSIYGARLVSVTLQGRRLDIRVIQNPFALV